MSDWSIAFAPLVPWWAIAALLAAALTLSAFGLWRRARGTLWRLAAFGLIALALARPLWLDEQWRVHPDVAIALVDESPSQGINGRTALRTAALERLREEARRLPNLEWREVRAGTPDPHAPGTRLFDAWRRAVADVPPGRRAGVLVLTDGQVHDRPAAGEVTGPLHLLLTGAPGERDRRLKLLQAPRYGIVGEPVTLAVQVDDLGVADPPASAQITVRRDGEVVRQATVPTGAPVELSLPLVRAGTAVVEISVAGGPAELTLNNNRAIASINAVRDRLRVLLISGKPYEGERVWRNLLKSDPAVDLVHFTILRPPTKQDLTPVEELSLISFPVRELFQEKLGEFDLIVFDRYSLRGLIAPAYLENIANYARNGGAVLIAVGPTYADRYASLHNSAIGDIMPAAPTGSVLEQGFRPAITAMGLRHPVTQGLSAPPTAAGHPWGRWFREIDATVSGGQVVMSGIGGRPLLVLDRVGEPQNQGRVAQILSDHIWLWARGFEGGGPHGELLRRLAHWLMKEPELEEEALLASAAGRTLSIEHRTLGDTPPAVTVTAPDETTRAVALHALGPGRFGASLPVAADGLYRVSDGRNTVVAAVGILDPKEWEDARASPEPLAETAHAQGGGTYWLSDGVPGLRRTSPGQTAAGRGWAGLQRNEAHTVTGLEQHPLLPTWLLLTLAAGLLVAVWWREAR
ncbi:MAG: hypothetical protein H6844_07195 [Alphaproteobacteria bacterium]|nr:hypothetical protein [Alphaproteobacteria bacterium]